MSRNSPQKRLKRGINYANILGNATAQNVAKMG